MPESSHPSAEAIALRDRRALVTVKVVHTLAWAFFVACILALPVASWYGDHSTAAVLAAVVLLEGLVLVANGWRCPLTLLAERYTDERHDSFDIYLPTWLARHNKLIFTVLYGIGLVYALARWLGAT